VITHRADFRELRERGGGVAARDDVDALAAKSNLDDFAHGAIVNEIDRGVRFAAASAKGGMVIVSLIALLTPSERLVEFGMHRA